MPSQPSAAEDRHVGIEQAQLSGGIDGLAVSGIAEGEDIFFESPAFDFPERPIKPGSDLLRCLKREEAVTGVCVEGLGEIIQGRSPDRSSL